MLYNKVIVEDSKLEENRKLRSYGKLRHVALIKYEILKGLIIGWFKNEKFKGLLNDGIKSDKLRFLMVARKRSSLLKLWTIRVAFLMLLWIIVVQFKGLGNMVTPSMFKARSALFLQPQSTYLNLSDDVTYS